MIYDEVQKSDASLSALNHRSRIGTTFLSVTESRSMENGLLKKIDGLIEKFKAENKGETPLYIVLSSEENKEVMAEVKARNNYPSDFIVTSYKGIKLAEHPSLLKGNFYVSNELPETGS